MADPFAERHITDCATEDRKLGEYVLPDGWVVIAAGNPASEQGIHFSMPRPLRNRFVHLELEADLNDWCKWAVGAGVRPEIIAFLRFKPDLLHTADATSDANAWPTPRSWEMSAEQIYSLREAEAQPHPGGQNTASEGAGAGTSTGRFPSPPPNIPCSGPQPVVVMRLSEVSYQ
jgi:hypothetical protein